MESWRKVWREGLAPVLTTPGLEALRGKLKEAGATSEDLETVK